MKEIDADEQLVNKLIFGDVRILPPRNAQRLRVCDAPEASKFIMFAQDLGLLGCEVLFEAQPPALTLLLAEMLDLSLQRLSPPGNVVRVFLCQPRKEMSVEEVINDMIHCVPFPLQRR